MKREPYQRRLLSLEEAATYLGRTIWGVRELVWKGKLPAVRIDRRVQLDIRDLEKFIEAHKVSEAS